MSTVFPNDFDSDLEIQRVDDNITEIGGDVINSLRDAVFMIERVVGLSPQGNKPSLAERVNVSLDDDGNIRSEAIESLGLVSLPITNTHVGSGAGIEESKLDLDFSTQSLKNAINSLATDLSGAQAGVSALASSLSLHILGLGNFHDGYDIQIGGVGLAGLSAETIGDALAQLVTLLLAGDPLNGIFPHINLNFPYTVKHSASEIGIDSSGFEIIDRSVTDLQSALSSVDAKQGAFGARHLDVFHANGILREISSGEAFNSNKKLLGPVAGANYDEGTSIITIPGVTSFSNLNVESGDILEIVSDVLDQATYQIRAVGPLTSSETLGDLPSLGVNQLAIFHVFMEGRAENDNVEINIYKPSSTSSQAAPLACAVRNNETIVDTITILNPDAARVISVGFNGAILNDDGYEIAIRVGLGNGQYRELTIIDLGKERLNVNQANPIDAKSVAERINAYVSHPSLNFHFPISAFRIGNELAIAHNLVGTDYTLEILDGYTANFALGLDAYGANVVGQVVVGNANNSYVVNGIELSSIRSVFDGYASIESATDTFALWTNDGQLINPLRYGITSGSVIHITGHDDLDKNGSYTLLSATSSTVSTFAAEQISAPNSPTVFNVTVTDSHIPLTDLDGTETGNGLVQVLINSVGQTLVHQRLMYGTNLGAAVEIVNVSDTFPLGSVTFNIIIDGALAIFNIISDSFAGATATVHKDFKGLVKVYHPNNLDYVIVKTIPGTLYGSVETITVNALLPADEALELCLIHFNGALKVTNVIDTRLFGNISSEQVRDDFVEIFSQKPVQELRSDGVVRGFDVLDIPFVDSITNMQALPVQGGVAYVNGVRVAVETQRVLIQSQDEQGSLVSGPRIVAINEFGSLQVFSDELGELLSDGYESSSVFGKLLPLYQVTLELGDIVGYIDLRLFINNIDNKLELIVDETNNVVGNFRSLEGALLYASSYPNREHLTIKIINAVYPSGQVVVPDGISIIGSSAWGGDSKHQIINSNNLGSSFLILSGNNRLENVEVVSEVAAMNGALLDIRGKEVNVEKCLLHFGQDVSSTDDDVGIIIGADANKGVRIIDNKLDMVYSGIISLNGCDNLSIEKNTITNLAGTGGVSHGIKLGTTTRPIDNASIVGNAINVPSVVTSADIRGISIDIGEAIGNLRIDSNVVSHTANNTMTNGIRIENESATGNKVAKLFMLNNVVDGIKLDDNDVWGIYLADVVNGQLHHNIISNVGVSAGNTDVGCIGIGANVDLVEASYNILKDCDVTRGIEITGAGQVHISNNTMDTLGASAYYVSGSSTHSSVSDNIMVGPGLKGIRWTGTNSKINDNNLSQPDDASDYAFSEHAIYIQTSDVDVMNNTITGMISAGAVGITNVSLARDRIKIIGNTISGSEMNKAIELFSDGHVVSNNRVMNDTVYASGTTLIEFNDVTNSVVMGNTLRGECDAVFEAISSLDNTTIANNTIDARDIDGNAVNIDNGFVLDVAQNCFIAGNKILNSGGTVGANTIGSATELSFGTGNSIGVNPGLLDIRNLPASKAITSFDTSGNPHWSLKADDWWELFDGTALTRLLYFPIEDLPNGTRLQSVQAQGTFLDGSLTIQAFRKSRTDLSTDTISSSDTITASTFGIIGNSDGSVNTTTNDADGELVDYYNYNYYAVITHSGGGTAASNQIHGLTVIFRY